MLVPALALLLAQAPASACITADEPEFATTKEHPAQVGGGPMGETLQYRRLEKPISLFLDASAAVRAWTAEPARLTGAPMVAPVTFQVTFGPR